MPDTGASSHFTLCLLDLQEVEEGLDLRVEVADDHFVHLFSDTAFASRDHYAIVRKNEIQLMF
jgi:hypothetical protein